MVVTRRRRLSLLLSDKEHRVLQRLAKAANVTASDYVRNWLHQQDAEHEVRRAWEGILQVHHEGMATLAGGEPVDYEPLKPVFATMFELMRQDYDNTLTLQSRLQVYRNALIAKNATADKVAREFEALALSSLLEKWISSIRGRDLA